MTNDCIPPGFDSLATHFGLSLVREDGKAMNSPPAPLPPPPPAAPPAPANPAAAPVSDPDVPAPPPPGSQLSLANIYQDKPDELGRMTWTSEEPKDAPDPAENEKTLGHAIVVRNKKSQDSRKKFEIHSIVIQSSWLKTALTEVFDGYPGVFCKLDRLVFDAPFKPFVHRWGQFLDFMKKEHTDDTMKAHLGLLHSVLSVQLKETIKAFEDYVKNGVITFNHVWTIFQPGAIIIAPSHFGEMTALEFESGWYTETQCGDVYRLKCNCVDWDGERFGWSPDYVDLVAYDGIRPISSLRLFPLAFHPSKESLKRSLIERGKKFEVLAGFHYQSYDGYALEQKEEGRGKIVYVSGRIVIDTSSWNTHSPLGAADINPFSMKDKSNQDNGAVSEVEDYELVSGHSGDHDKDSVGDNSANSKRPQKMRLTEYQLLLCNPSLKGYSLKLKKWLKFFVDYVDEIEWNNNAFESLVLAEEQKDLVLALSQTQAAGLNIFDDVIQGKGKGMILLLTGPPGVGKTLTAESVAENMRVPLYMMSAGDLGIRPDEVEENLNSILELVAKWKAILLIDECDVFLEARSVHDLERNKLVSIFLRLLEYYEGILFLTTNRVENMDQAFQSRIHITIKYPDLTSDSRKHIWQNFLAAMNYATDFGPKDYDELANENLNGRQIKNMVKAAQLLAVSKRETLTRKHVNVILAIERYGSRF